MQVFHYLGGEQSRSISTSARRAPCHGQCGAHRLVSNVVGHLKKGVSDPMLYRALEYWRNIDKRTGDRIVSGVNDR